MFNLLHEAVKVRSQLEPREEGNIFSLAAGHVQGEISNISAFTKGTAGVAFSYLAVGS